MAQNEEIKVPFAEHTTKHDKRRAGRTDAMHTQVEIRSGGHDLEPELKAWIYERLGRQLGKYATQIERIQVRFGDENGPKNGNDKCCLVHVILSKLPPVVVEIRGDTEREAFDLAASRAERATRRNMEKHGFSTHHHQKKQHSEGELRAVEAATNEPDDASSDGLDVESEDSLLGRREGHRREQIEALVRGEQGDVDTSAAGTSEDDRTVGADHTATRNVKLNDAGMPYRLEDSTTGKPSRKSTRGGANRLKHGDALAKRTKGAIHSPKETHTRAAVRNQGG